MSRLISVWHCQSSFQSLTKCKTIQWYILKFAPGDCCSWCFFHGITKGNDCQRDRNTKRVTHRVVYYGSQSHVSPKERITQRFYPFFKNGQKRMIKMMICNNLETYMKNLCRRLSCSEISHHTKYRTCKSINLVAWWEQSVEILGFCTMWILYIAVLTHRRLGLLIFGPFSAIDYLFLASHIEKWGQANCLLQVLGLTKSLRCFRNLEWDVQAICCKNLGWFE